MLYYITISNKFNSLIYTRIECIKLYINNEFGSKFYWNLVYRRNENSEQLKILKIKKKIRNHEVISK